MSVSEPIAVTGGLVRGIPSPLDPAITEYRAIPYAADPSGENRFKPPQPVVPWEGVRLCDTNPPINHQLPPPPPYVDPLAEVPQGEDILYLNMWTPTKPHVVDQPCPVFMWIYGGGYREGGNSDKNFDGTALAQKAMLLYSPLTKNLFHRAIFQSGIRHPRDPLMIHIAGSYRDLKEAEADGVGILQELGVSSIEELRSYPDPKKFAEIALRRDPRLWGPPPLFRGVLDGHVLTKKYMDNLSQGPPNDVPIMDGHNSEEGAVYAEPRFSVEDLHQCVRERFGAGSEWERRFFEVYPMANDEPGKGPLDTWNTSCREHTKTNLSLFAQEWSKKAKSPVFGYYFTHAPPPHRSGFRPDFSTPKTPGFTWAKGPLVGAFHSADLAYTFNSIGSNDSRLWTQRDRQVGDIVSTLWACFIKTGDPNGQESQQESVRRIDRWPNLVTHPTKLLELGGEFGQIEVATPAGFQFWSDLILSQSKSW